MPKLRKDKPHIEYTHLCEWYCSCGIVGGYGLTAKEAYHNWKKTLVSLFPPYSDHYRTMLKIK